MLIRFQSAPPWLTRNTTLFVADQNVRFLPGIGIAVRPTHPVSDIAVQEESSAASPACEWVVIPWGDIKGIAIQRIPQLEAAPSVTDQPSLTRSSAPKQRR
jgi:hypothetical protein